MVASCCRGKCYSKFGEEFRIISNFNFNLGSNFDFGKYLQLQL